MKYLLIIFFLTTALYTFAQSESDSIPTWTVHYGQSIIYKGDITKINKEIIIELKLESKEPEDLTLKVIYKTSEKIKSQVSLDLYEIGAVEWEMEEIGTNNIHDIPLVNILDMAEMVEINGDFRITINYKDDKYFKSITSLATIVIKR